MICVPLFAGTVAAFFYIERLADDNRRLVVRSLEIGRETEKLIGHAEELSRTAQQYLVVGENELYKLYTQKHYRLLDTVEWLELLIERRENLRLLGDIRGASKTAHDRIQTKRKSPDAEVGVEAFEELVLLSGNLRTLANSSIQTELDRATRRVEGARTVLYWIWGVSLVFVLALVVVFTLSIARPIRRIDFHIRRLGQGDFDGAIRIKGPTDISELGDRLDWLRTRLSEIDQIKERFFREMSHQLKTPLASIREGTELLLDTPNEDRPTHDREVLEILQKNSIELQRMLDNMLKFSAWRADPGKLFRQRFRIKQVIEDIVRRFGPSLLTYNITLEVDCADDLEVDMDREKCGVILDNLVSNALKFSPEGGKVTVGAWQAPSSVELVVSDEGPGVPPADRERIFELYYLNEGPADNRLRGTGIGLSLVRAYVEAHGGKVYVEPAGEKGAHFRVSISS